ncbi:MAG: hypothetical protein IKQ54_06255 [Oscillospiraceae bacterium]|nr:hypothetical protein [Oscillospiraceae bacterium]
MSFIGFDTSNYTTSVAAFDGVGGENVSRLLPVRTGELGLRQSEALFSHVKRLPELSDRLFAHLDPGAIAAVGVSTRPRAVEGSYMPCFLAGESQARVLASALHVPLYVFSHQQGHIAAVLWSAGRLDLLGSEFLAWHLSGGTTELLLVRSSPAGEIDCERIGGTTDISAGQLIDRTGQLLGLDFPAGKALDELASRLCHSERSEESVSPAKVKGTGSRQQETGDADCHGQSEDWPRNDSSGQLSPVGGGVLRSAASPFGNAPGLARRDYFRVKVHGTEFSLSGVQNQVQNYFAKGTTPAETAYFALRSVAEAVRRATNNARKEHPLPVLFSGGVASNSMLRRMMPDSVFGAPQYSTDNAMGIAVLTWLRFHTTP